MSPHRTGAALPQGQRPLSPPPTQAAKRLDPQPGPLPSISPFTEPLPPPRERGGFRGLRWRSKSQGPRAGACGGPPGPPHPNDKALSRPRSHWIRNPEDPCLDVPCVRAHTSVCVCVGTGMYSHTTGKAQLLTGGLCGPETLHSDRLPQSEWLLHTHTHTGHLGKALGGKTYAFMALSAGDLAQVCVGNE